MKYYVETPIELYTYEELNKKTKARIENNKVQQMLDIIPYESASPNMKKAIDKAKEMKTPWFTTSYMYDYCYSEIVKNIKADEALYNRHGKPIVFSNEKGDYFLYGALLTPAEQDHEFVPVHDVEKIMMLAGSKELFAKTATANAFKPSLLNRFAKYHNAAEIRAEVEKEVEDNIKYYMKSSVTQR